VLSFYYAAERPRRWRLDTTLARRLAEAEAMCALPEHFQGNALALLQAVYRNTANELRVPDRRSRQDPAVRSAKIGSSQPRAPQPSRT
jgi:hypothetical protein